MSSDHISAPNAELMPIIAECISRGQTVELRVRGYSMRPYIEHERDIVVLSPITGPLRIGDVILAQVGQGLYALHRIIRLSGDCITMKGDGNIGAVEQVRASDVIALAIGFKRKGRTVVESTDQLKWRIYSYIWPRLCPLRRILLGVDRRIPFLRWML